MKNIITKILGAGVILGSLVATGFSQTGYWKYDRYEITPSAEQLRAIKALPGRAFEQRASGAVQAGPGSGKGALDLYFKTDNPDREVHLATMSASFSANASLASLVPLQKVVFDMSVSVGANEKARAIGTTGRGTIAIDSGEYFVEVVAKPDQGGSGRGTATIPGGGPGANMFINVGSYLGQLGALSANLRMIYVWVEGAPPRAVGTPPRVEPSVANLALKRPTKQSSNSQWSKPNDAQGAVNGVKNRSFGFHTNRESNPWWQVDLGAVKRLTEIRIFNRLDCCGERARTIRVLLSNDGIRWRRVYAHNGSVFGGADGRPLIVSVRGNSARYVRLQLAEVTWFHLDEVEIY
ncbi:MAG: discoidin domain-containing protein [Chloracidobacterium sp.]|nr:discoidin domain-containing protein [Chloracidobacterium sp.]